jgi:hypothetical protein
MNVAANLFQNQSGETAMSDTRGAAKAAPKAIDAQKTEQEISWLGARLREKSTYAGLTVAVSLALPFLAKFVPALADANAAQIVNDISAIGIGVGGLIAIVMPEKGSAKAIAFMLAIAGALAFGQPAHAQAIGTVSGAPTIHHVRHRAHAAAPLPARAIYDSAAAPGKPSVAQAQQNPLLVLQQFTVADLQAALKDAQSQTPPDTTAASCYTALIPFVQSQAQNPLPAGAGIFQALQKARDAKAYLANIQSPTGPLAGLNQACAPLVLDVQNTLLTLGVSVGVIANPAGAAATLTGLPAAVAAFLGLPKL